MLRRLLSFAVLALLYPSTASAQFAPPKMPAIPFPRIEGFPEDLQKDLMDLQNEFKEFEKVFGQGLIQQQQFGGRNAGNGSEVRWGGLHLKKANAGQQEKLGLPENEGLIVAVVDPNTPAEKAGVKVNDVLVKINNTAVSNDFTLFAKMIKEQKADEPLELVVIRDGKEETIKGAKMPAVAQANPFGGVDAGGLMIRNGANVFVFPRVQFNPIPAAPRFPNANLNPVQRSKIDNLNLDMNINGARIIRKQSPDQFSGEFSKDELKITIKGTFENGQTKLSEINVQDGAETKKYTRMLDVPAQYRPTIQQVLLPSSTVLILPQNIPSIPKLPRRDS